MSLALEEAQLATLISERIRTSERRFTVYAPYVEEPPPPPPCSASFLLDVKRDIHQAQRAPSL